MGEFSNAKKELQVGDQKGFYFDLNVASDFGDLNKMPFTLKILLENLLRNLDKDVVSENHIKALASWSAREPSKAEMPYYPSRVLMQDFTGVPGVVDLAAMREGVKALGGDPKVINPQVPVDLVIDHSVMVDFSGTPEAYQKNMDLEFERNNERYEFLKWGQKAFDNFRVVPPGTGICHQVNCEYLASVIASRDVNGETQFFPDTLFGTDSHTTMVNGVAVLGWGVGGIEAEAAMLGKPTYILIPEVVGFELTGRLPEGATATDLVLTVTQMLRKEGVVGKFVEFCGDGLGQLSLANRLTIANMAPEYGATCGFFPIDDETIKYLSLSGRSKEQTDLVKAYAQKQGMWRQEGKSPDFSNKLTLDLGDVVPSIAGPKRPQDRINLTDAETAFEDALKTTYAKEAKTVEVKGADHKLSTGDIVIAAITSCTNTSNPAVMVAAGLVAQKAAAKGLKVKPWVKTSLAPGSQVVSEYLNKSGLQKDLDTLGFNIVGYGCTTCIGNSGPLDDNIKDAVEDNDLVVCSVLSGNRNFEGRISPQVQANYLASPPLVVAYALAGTMTKNLTTEAIDFDSEGSPVFLKDIWPSQEEVNKVIEENISTKMFIERYADVFEGPKQWKDMQVTGSETYSWNNQSTYVQNPPFFEGLTKDAPTSVEDIKGASVLALLGDSVTTDHISPAGSIKNDSPAGAYLQANKVSIADFNSYGSRRGNHEVMMRGTFANIRIKNEMLDGVVGGYTRFVPTGEQMAIYDAAMKYKEVKTPLVVVAGKEYGTGSSRDWAAKGTALLGVKTVIAESYERIHRSNLVGMGVMPLEFTDGVTRKTLKMTGDETFNITGFSKLSPQQTLEVEMTRKDGSTEAFKVKSRLDTMDDIENFKNGGILQATIRQLIQ